MLAERRPRGHLAHNQPHSPPAVRCCGVRSVRRNASPVKAVAHCRGWKKTWLRPCQRFSLRWLVNRKRHCDSFWPGNFILIQSIQSMSILVTSCSASIPSLQLDYHFKNSIKKTNKRGIHVLRETGDPFFQHSIHWVEQKRLECWTLFAVLDSITRRSKGHGAQRHAQHKNGETILMRRAWFSGHGALAAWDMRNIFVQLSVSGSS